MTINSMYLFKKNDRTSKPLDYATLRGGGQKSEREGGGIWL